MTHAVVAVPPPGTKSMLPTNIRVHEDLTTQYDATRGKIKKLAQAPRYLPVIGHTPYDEAHWWWQRLQVWAIVSPAGLDNLLNAHTLWVIGQLCPPGTGPWKEHGHLLSLGYGVALGHLHAPRPILAGAVNAITPMLQPLAVSIDPDAQFQLSTRFPRR